MRRIICLCFDKKTKADVYSVKKTAAWWGFLKWKCTFVFTSKISAYTVP